MTNVQNNSRINNEQTLQKLKYDINSLLNCFNEIDKKNTGCISRQSTKMFFRTLQINNFDKFLGDNANEKYQFDKVLSILGIIDQPHHPSAYVCQFIKVLSEFRNNCLKGDEQHGLLQANEIDKRIKLITSNEIERHTTRLQIDNKKTLAEMEINQIEQFQIFEKQWKEYIGQFSNKTKQRIHQTIDFRNKSLQHDESRFVQTSRRRYSMLTSTKLTELEERKKRLVKEGKYNEALVIKQKIAREKQLIQLKHNNDASFVASRRLESMNKKKESILETTMMSAHNNVEKLHKKKKEGEYLFRIRMKNVKDETVRRLQESLRREVAKVKSLLNQAAKK